MATVVKRKRCSKGTGRSRTTNRCSRTCKKDEIKNPKTGRCIKRSGKAGKAVIAARKSWISLGPWI